MYFIIKVIGLIAENIFYAERYWVTAEKLLSFIVISIIALARGLDVWRRSGLFYCLLESIKFTNKISGRGRIRMYVHM